LIIDRSGLEAFLQNFISRTNQDFNFPAFNPSFNNPTIDFLFAFDLNKQNIVYLNNHFSNLKSSSLTYEVGMWFNNLKI